MQLFSCSYVAACHVQRSRIGDFLLQNKKRKASALLAISELNDADKAAKKIKKDEKVDLEVKKLETSKTSKPLLEGEEYEELKRRLRERKKALSCNPIFRLKTVGEEALMNRKSRVPLFMSDIQVGECLATLDRS